MARLVSTKSVLFLLCVIVLGMALAWVISAPTALTAKEVAALPVGDAGKGERLFWAGGCASCHADAKATGDEKLRLGGGVELHSPFGTFVAPNISPHKTEGLGSWSLADFTNAMKRGVSPDGRHYFPAFPYTSYVNMQDQDVSDLRAYLNTLEPVEIASKPHKVGFPFNIRRAVGFWKFLYFDPTPDQPTEAASEQIALGRYLVEALGHCGECHTPRNVIGGPKADRRLAGGPSPEGDGTIPNITPHADGIGGWSVKDIVYSLETGFTPEFDSFGSSMTSVQQNMAKLTDEDRQAIAAYLKSIPPLSD